jgi:hypothetical protein
MKIELINDDFEPQEALEILTKLIHVNIKFHLDKINVSSNKIDINMRETRIKRLQKHLFEISEHIEMLNSQITIQSSVTL